MLQSTLLVGKRLNNYRVITEISSSTYQVEAIYLKQPPLRLKFLQSPPLTQEKQKQFLQEAYLIKKLNHAHLLPLLDVGVEDGQPYIVTEFAAGSLLKRLRAAPHQLLPLQETLALITQVGRVLHYTHQRNIIHGNLKPENILFKKEHEALLTDFTIVTFTDALHNEDAHRANTFPYMAPEQFQGWMQKASDQYALGCLAYELFTGQVPFTAATFSEYKHKHLTEKPIAPTQLNLLLPLALEEALLKALEKKSEDRFATTNNFIDALNAALPSHTQRPHLPKIEISRPASPLLIVYEAQTASLPAVTLAEPKVVQQESFVPIPAPPPPPTMPVQQQTQHEPLYFNVEAPTVQLVPIAGNTPLLIGKGYQQGGKQIVKRMWLIIAAVWIVILATIFGSLYLALPASLIPKFGSQTVSHNPVATTSATATSAPSLTPIATSTSILIVIPTARPTPTLAPTAIPTATPSPPPTPTPTAVPALLVNPTSIQAENDCRKGGLYYMCALTLQLPSSYVSSRRWSASGSGIITFFIPSRGILAPGQLQSVIVYINSSCPHAGLLLFTTKDGKISVPWKC